jgi:hypothetical protein
MTGTSALEDVGRLAIDGDKGPLDLIVLALGDRRAAVHSLPWLT